MLDDEHPIFDFSKNDCKLIISGALLKFGVERFTLLILRMITGGPEIYNKRESVLI
jgi:hypothetical protein